MIAAEPTDHDLLLAWRDGDALAGDLLVRRHFDAIFGFLRAKAPEHVDELIQRTFLGCAEAVDRIDEDLNFRAYLFGIARRQLIYHFRRSRREAARFDPMLESVLDAGGTPSRVVAMRQEERVVLDALNALPLDLQIILELHYWEGMAVGEIGQVLEVPAGTVKSRLFRARERLRELLGTHGGADDDPTADSPGAAPELRALQRSLRPDGGDPPSTA